MALTKQKKSEIAEKFSAKPNDTGSTSVQIALLTERIKYLSEHLSINKKDHSSRRGLLRVVTQRKKLLSYLQKNDKSEYQKLIRQLGLRK